MAYFATIKMKRNVLKTTGKKNAGEVFKTWNLNLYTFKNNKTDLSCCWQNEVGIKYFPFWIFSFSFWRSWKETEVFGGKNNPHCSKTHLIKENKIVANVVDACVDVCVISHNTRFVTLILHKSWICQSNWENVKLDLRTGCDLLH